MQDDAGAVQRAAGGAGRALGGLQGDRKRAGRQQQFVPCLQHKRTGIVPGQADLWLGIERRLGGTGGQEEGAQRRGEVAAGCEGIGEGAADGLIASDQLPERLAVGSLQRGLPDGGCGPEQDIAAFFVEPGARCREGGAAECIGCSDQLHRHCGCAVGGQLNRGGRKGDADACHLCDGQIAGGVGLLAAAFVDEAQGLDGLVLVEHGGPAKAQRDLVWPIGVESDGWGVEGSGEIQPTSAGAAGGVEGGGEGAVEAHQRPGSVHHQRFEVAAAPIWVALAQQCQRASDVGRGHRGAGKTQRAAATAAGSRKNVDARSGQVWFGHQVYRTGAARGEGSKGINGPGAGGGQSLAILGGSDADHPLAVGGAAQHKAVVAAVAGRSHHDHPQGSGIVGCHRRGVGRQAERRTERQVDDIDAVGEIAVAVGVYGPLQGQVDQVRAA